MKHLKNMLALLLAFAMLLSCVAVVSAEAPNCPSKEFSDVPAVGHWAHESIDFMIGNGYMNGTSTVEKRFSPNTTTSRAMIVQILYKMAGQPAVKGEMKFNDVAEGTWYYNAVLWAVQNGVANGTSETTFNPNDDVTREQIANFLRKRAGISDAYDTACLIKEFPDANQVSSWAGSAMAWAASEGIITGKSKNDAVYLDPKGLATRAEVATMISRYAQMLVETPEEFLSLLDYDKAMEDAQYLVEEIGVRLTGTAAELIGLGYLEAQYKQLGYETEFQDFTLTDRTAGDIRIRDMVIAAGTPSKNDAYTGFGKATGASVYLEDPAKAADLKDLEGKIVFFPGNCRASRGTAIHPATYEAIAALEKAGAAGIVVMMDPTTEETERYQIRVSTPNFSSMGMTSDIPILITNAIDAEKLQAFFAEHEGEEVTMEAYDHVDSHNLIVTKKAARETDLTLYVTCHIDSVLPSPGANDNASGIVGVLAMARAFKNVPTNYNIQFITFGAEEVGLQGARYFANNLSEQQIADAIGNYNLDMVATSQEDCVYIFMNSSTNLSAPVNDPSLETHVTRMSRAAAEALDYDLEYYRTCYDRTTDHYALHLVGIPAVEFDWRANAQGTAFEAYYHTRFDDFEHNFSREKLQTQVDIIALAVYNDATADYAAVVGEGVYREYYNTLAEALDAVEDGSVVKLLKDSDEDYTFARPVSFTLDENGYVRSGVIKAVEGFNISMKSYEQGIYEVTVTLKDFLSLLDYDKAMEDAQYLVEEIGVRLTGTKSEIKGLDYLETQYKELGYEIERQDFTLTDRTSGDIHIGDMVVAAGTPSKNEAYTGFGKAEGTAVYLEDPAKAAELKDLEGKIVFFPGNCRASRGTAIHPATYEAISALEKAGAAGIVVMMDPTTEETERYQIRVSTPNFSSMSMTSATPILITNAMDAEKLTAYLKENDGAAVTMEVRDHVDSQNLIVTKKAARETDLTIYVTCHIDSVLPSPGANDNASGIVGVLAMARAFKNIPTNYNIQFITFGAEEVGLQGAHYFSKNLTEQQIADAIGNYNLDMVATSQENCVYIFMNSSTNPQAPVNDESLETHVTRMSRSAAEALDFDLNYYRTCYDRTTDHYALHLVGIPAVEFDWRANEAGTAFEDYYHTRFDDFEHNFSREKLQTQVDIISLAVYNDATADYAAVAGEGVYREYYNTVAEAVEAVEDGSVVTLLKDSDESITVSEAVSFTLNENGYAFSGEIKAGEGFELTQEDNVYTIYVPVKEPNWVSTWATAEERNDINADRMPQLPLNGSTVRQIIRVTTSGETMKLTFSNQYGKSDVTVKSLHIAKQVQADKSTIDTATDTIVTVGGSEEFVIPAGKTVVTDPVYFPVNALDNVAVSMFFGPSPSNNITGHRGARATTYQISGNQVSAETFGSGTKTTTSWFFLSDVALDMPEGSRAIVCFGDSITDGYGTDASYLGKKPDAYTRWGDYFAKRLQADENTKNVSVLNEGIGSNSMLGSYPTDAGKDRYARDLLEHDGVEYVIILFGVNDMERLQNTNKYQQLITEYKKMIDLAHENDIKVYVAPVLPFGKNASYYSAASEQLRTMVNDWFRSEAANVDAIIDFESAVADPNNPTSLLPKYTSDGLHPDSGYDVMANAIDLSLFYE